MKILTISTVKIDVFRVFSLRKACDFDDFTGSDCFLMKNRQNITCAKALFCDYDCIADLGAQAGWKRTIAGGWKSAVLRFRTAERPPCGRGARITPRRGNPDDFAVVVEKLSAIECSAFFHTQTSH